MGQYGAEIQLGVAIVGRAQQPYRHVTGQAVTADGYLL
jgi:hypothetical protein